MGERSQSRLQMGAAILGKSYEQLWRGVGPVRILINRRSGGGLLPHALGIIVDAAQTTFTHSTCLSDSLHHSDFMVLLDDVQWQFFCFFFNEATIIFIRKLPHHSCIMLPRVTLKRPHFSGVSGVFLYLHLN